MNNDRLQQNLNCARIDLLAAQEWLARSRREGIKHPLLGVPERMVCRALDRAWEAQCMANGVGWGK